jgi:hypothetical protein
MAERPLPAEISAKLPPAPERARLAAIGPARYELTPGTLLWRVYGRGGRHPLPRAGFSRFGPVATMRFDQQLPDAQGHPQGQERGILYGAQHGPTCLAEVFQATRVIDRHDRDPWLVAFRLAAPIALLDLTGTWPTRAGATMALASGPRAWARAWSVAIYDLYPAIGGLWYPSSMAANRPSFALYERATTTFPAAPVFHRALADPLLFPWLRAAADEFGYGLV